MSSIPIEFPKFFTGTLVATPHALKYVKGEDILSAVERHLFGDWGDLSENDKAANDAALVNGTRLLSAYTSKLGVKFWVLTEADRSMTTILLPEEY